MSKPLVYIASPYTSPDPVENTHKATVVGTRLVDAGIVTPFLPLLSMLWHAITPRPVEWWYAYDLEILARCDALLRLPGPSVGADKEVAEAQRLGIPVFDDINTMHAWAALRG